MSANIIWTPEAEARLKEIPFFVRPAARKKIEKFAQEQGIDEITVDIYERAKQQFGWFFVTTNKMGSGSNPKSIKTRLIEIC